MEAKEADLEADAVAVALRAVLDHLRKVLQDHVVQLVRRLPMMIKTQAQ